MYKRQAKNSCYINEGVVISKYTGHGGKYDTSDASAEYMGKVRSLLYTVQVDHRDTSHVRQGDKLIQIFADGLQLLEHFFRYLMSCPLTILLFGEYRETD